MPFIHVSQTKANVPTVHVSSLWTTGVGAQEAVM